MPVLSLCNHKGGTGKTTSAIHLAAAYGTGGMRILLIDLDPQGFLTRMLGVGEPDERASSLVLFDHEAKLSEIPVVSLSRFDLLPSSYSMTRAARGLNKPTDVLWLRESLATAHDYDLIMIDTAAAMTVFSLNALVASDVTLIPVTPEYQPVVGAEQTYSTARLVQEKLNPRLKEPLFLLTQVDARKRDHAALSSFVRRSYGQRVLRTEIRTSASLAESATGGATVFDRDIQSRGARDYSHAADELGAAIFGQPFDRVARAQGLPPVTGQAGGDGTAAARHPVV
jgi:chromosome partitioning protein